MNVSEALQSAITHYQTGDLEKTEYICKELLSAHPDNVIALNLLGILYLQRKTYHLAIEYFTKAVQSAPANSDIYYNLANAFKDSKQFNEAITHYKKAIQLNPIFFEAYQNLGIVFLDKRQFDVAIHYFQKALQLNPALVGSYYNLGIAFQETGRLNEAITYYQKTIALNPSDAEAHDNLGTTFQEMGLIDEAVKCYRKAIQLAPNLMIAYNNLGCALLTQGKNDEALSVYDKALEHDPDNIMIRWSHCMAQLLIIYPTQTSIEIARNKYSDELLKLKDAIALSTPDDIEAAAMAVGKLSPFYLPYQGLNDRRLQEIYGNLVSRIMAKRYPQYAADLSVPAHLSDEPIRVGFISGFFNNHAVWKIMIKGWIENLDKQRFKLYGYYTGKKKDKVTEIARQVFSHFIEDIYLFEDLCQIIRNDNLHVLIYSDIGMDPTVLKLAALRLAPIQCSTVLGHPETPGIPTIDYCLSSDLMEPADADKHYSEHLIRLPNLSAFYTPLEIQSAQLKRDTFRLRPKSILYLCCQSLFKYLPQYDAIYPQIAEQVGDCQFLFISHEDSQITEQFRSRVSRAFNKFDLKADDYVVLLPRLSTEQYNAINCVSDIFLDSIGWSGGNTTLEAIACNLPIVTLPGEFMRGRHSMAILEMMGVRETIAKTLKDYVEIAVKLGQDPEWRRLMSDNIAANRDRVYRDRACISGLEEFLEKLVKKR